MNGITKLTLKNKKGEMLLSPFLPQIYHKLNLLKIMVAKCTLKLMIYILFSMNVL